MTARVPAPSARNVLRVFRAASGRDRLDGREWYRRAYRLAVELDSSNPARAAGVIAVLSPQTPWARNVYLARTAYMLAADGLDVDTITAELPVLKVNARKAAMILAGADPDLVVSGPKVRAFWRTIVNPADPAAVVVDRHAIDVACGYVLGTDARDAFYGRRGTYEQVVTAYARAARILSRELGETWHPSEVQAVTWTAWRRDHGHTQARTEARREDA